MTIKNMTKDDIIRMTREAGLHVFGGDVIEALERFAVLIAEAEREKLAAWMIRFGFSTGHGDTMEQLLEELGTEILDSIDFAVGVEREACAKLLEDASGTGKIISCESAAKAIRARGNDAA